jgi:glycosyltransferase involved in cell wall biosynthesis
MRYFQDYVTFLDDQVDVRLMDWPRHRSPKNAIFLFQVVRLVRRLKPDVVHVLMESVIWLNLAVPAFRKHGLVTTIHDVRYHVGDHGSRRVPRRFADSLITNSDRLIVHGAGLKAEAEQRYPHRRGNIEVLPHLELRRYFNIARKNKLRRREDPAVNVLFFGRIYAYKGLDVLIRSIPLVTDTFAAIRVIIAGEGDDIEPYRALMKDPQFFEIRNRRIPDDETAQLFTDADIVVLPYIDASQSGVLAIANSFAKPVIVTDVGELGRSVQNGESGIIIKPGDEKALADAILTLARDATLRHQMGAAGRADAERKASPELVAEGAMRIYDQTINSRVKKDT